MVKASLFLVLVGALLLVSSSPLFGALPEIPELPIIDGIVDKLIPSIGCEIIINDSCPENSTWKLGKPCANGCGQENATCPDVCACICNDGYRMHNGKCITKESCP